MKIRKALSFALCLVMLFSLVPMAAFAADGTSLQFRHGYWNDELERNEPSEERYNEMVKDYPHSGEYFFYLVDAQGRETPVNADELIFEGAVHPERYEGLAENEVRICPDTTGVSATEFGPGVACNRAQVVTFLWRAAGKPGPDSNANPFGDVAEGVYYYDAVLWAVENGITTGLSSTAFGPGSVCNRGQIVTFLYRHFED